MGPRCTEALKSIPPTAQDSFLFLTAVKPLVDASASFAKDVVKMLEDANKEEDANETSAELLLLAKGNVKGLEKVAELTKKSIKDMVLQHLVKGGSDMEGVAGGPWRVGGRCRRGSRCRFWFARG